MTQGELDPALEDQIQRLLESLNEKLDEVRRNLNMNVSELEFQVLEKLDDMKREIEGVKARVSKLEDQSAWNILIEEADKFNMSPEQLLKKALTEYRSGRKRE